MRRSHAPRHWLPQVVSRVDDPALSFALFGLVSLLWLIVRTGTKPSRAVYPCQRVAASHASAWIGVAAVPLLARRRAPFGPHTGRASSQIGLAVVLVVVVLLTAPFVGSFGVRRAGAVAATGGTATQATLDTRAIAAHSVVDSAQIVASASLSDIFAVTGTNGADGGVSRMIRMMEHQGAGFYRRSEPYGDGIVGTDDVVLIKINGQWDSRGGTNTDLVRSLVGAIDDHPDGFTGEIVIADNGQAQYGSAWIGGSLDWQNNNARDRSQSIADVVAALQDHVRVSAYLWDEITTTPVSEYSDGDMEDGYIVAPAPSPDTGIIVSYPKFTTAYGTQVSFKHGVWDSESARYEDRLVVLNVPVPATALDIALNNP